MKRHLQGEPTDRFASAAYMGATITVGWGALAFGAVYRWAEIPLAAAACFTGLSGLLCHRTSKAPLPKTIVVSLGLIIACAVVQLVPLPTMMLHWVSPATTATLRDYDPVYALGLRTHHALSLAPPLTAFAIGMLGAFSLLFIGMVRLISVVGAVPIIERIVWIGVALAIGGIVQNATGTDKPYGFWTPETPGTPFGPYVNRNHFAGWMLMGIPLTMCLALAGYGKVPHGSRASWRDRILWLASRDANRSTLIAAAACLMTLSLVLTRSRSGIAALSLVIVTIATQVASTANTTARKVATVGFVAAIAVFATLFAGFDTITDRFHNVDLGELNNRQGAWEDAITIIRAFPLAGTGLNTYGVASLFFQTHDLTNHYAQAHNDYLQLAAEGGLLLILPVSVFALSLANRVRRCLADDRSSSARWCRLGAIAALTGIAAQEVVEFSLQMPGNFALFAVVCAIASHRPILIRRAQ